MSQWYYTTDGQQAGPVELAELQRLLGLGSVKPSDMVWHEGMSGWQYPHAVAELSAAGAQAPNAPAYGIAVAPQDYPQIGYPQYGYATGASDVVAPMVNYYTPSPYSPHTAARPYAGFWLRLGASFLDGLIVGIPLVIVELAVLFAIGPQRHGDNSGISLLMDVINLFALWPYYALMESSPRQATLGKRICGIHVTDLNGQRLTFGRASGRYFGKVLSAMICYIGFIMAGFTERKQALHDQVAGTLVVVG